MKSAPFKTQWKAEMDQLRRCPPARETPGSSRTVERWISAMKGAYPVAMNGPRIIGLTKQAIEQAERRLHAFSRKLFAELDRLDVQIVKWDDRQPWKIEAEGRGGTVDFQMRLGEVQSRRNWTDAEKAKSYTPKGQYTQERRPSRGITVEVPYAEGHENRHLWRDRDAPEVDGKLHEIIATILVMLDDDRMRSEEREAERLARAEQERTERRRAEVQAAAAKQRDSLLAVVDARRRAAELRLLISDMSAGYERGEIDRPIEEFMSWRASAEVQAACLDPGLPVGLVREFAEMQRALDGLNVSG